MGYQIAMTPPVDSWLADLRHHDPAGYDRVAAALAALRERGDEVGPPLVVPVDEQLTGGGPAVRPPDRPHRSQGGGLKRRARDRTARSLTSVGCRFALAGLDAALKRQLSVLAGARRSAAVTAMTRKRLEIDLERLTEQGGAPDQAGRIDELRRQHAVALSQEDAANAVAGNLHAKIQAFKAARQSVEAACGAAEEAVARARADSIESGYASVGDRGGLGGAGRPTFTLSELRPGAPGHTEIRVIFAVEPDDTAVLLAAGTDRDWLRAWYREVIPLSRFRYQEKQRERVPRAEDS